MGSEPISGLGDNTCMKMRGMMGVLDEKCDCVSSSDDLEKSLYSFNL